MKYIVLCFFLTLPALGDPPPDQPNASADHSAKAPDASATLSIPTPASSAGSPNTPGAVTGSTILSIIQQLQKLTSTTAPAKPAEAKQPPTPSTDGKQATAQDPGISEADLKLLKDSLLKELKKAEADAPNDPEVAEQTKKVIDEAKKDDFFNDSLAKENRAAEERFRAIFKKEVPDF